MHLPFSPKLRLAALWPAATALLVVAVLLYLQLPGILATAAARDLDDTARLAERALELPEAATGVPDPDLQGAAQRWVRGTSLRLTVIESGGRVVADSARAADQVAAMEDHSDRPEVRAALARGQGSDWIPLIQKTVSTRGEGIAELLAKLEQHRAWLTGTPEGAARRKQRLREAMHVELREALTEAAISALGPAIEASTAAVEAREMDPYTAAEQLVEAFRSGSIGPRS